MTSIQENTVVSPQSDKVGVSMLPLCLRGSSLDTPALFNSPTA